MDDKNIRTCGKIIEYAEKILSYCESLNYDDFMMHGITVEACVFNLIQIGESVRHFSDEFLAKHGNIPWQQIRSLRNRIVHNYDNVDTLMIWDIIKDDLQNLIRQLNEIIPRL